MAAVISASGRARRLARICLQVVVFVSLLLVLPLLGLVLADQPVAPYLEFPPRTHLIDHAPFSWAAFWPVAVAAATALGITVYLAWPRGRRGASPSPYAAAPFPVWGWIGLLALGGAWTLAWTRLPWMRPVQPFTFTPIWLGYIVVINALTLRRTGHCLLRDRPGFLAALFPASAVFWWYFEYLNRFAQNWHYVGTDAFGPWTYTIHATVSFATVLPAVASTMEWLNGHALLRRGLDRALDIETPRGVAAGTLAIAAAGLLGLGLWPDYLFPLLWIAPGLVVLALQRLFGQETWLTALRAGRWDHVYIPALAALGCGLLWELWNMHSQAKWVYSIPFVEGFHLFEMPLLGFAGYLPFGVECAVVIDLVARLFPRPAAVLNPGRGP